VVQASFKFNSKQVQKALKRSPDTIAKWVRLALDQHGQVYKREMGKRFSTDAASRKTKTLLTSRSGALLGSITYVVSGGSLRDLKLTFHVGNRQTIKYAVTQEEGRVILGKPWLAIPLPAALTGTGRSRIESPKLVMGQPGWFITRTKKGNLLIGRKVGGGVEFWWVLKRQVKIPARLGFEKTVNSKRLRDDRLKRINNGIIRGLQEAAR
jgi:hypothetical protein